MITRTTKAGGEEKVRPSFTHNHRVDDRPSEVMEQLTEDLRNVCEEIRNELRSLNALFGCANFQNIPTVLKGISLNTRKPRRRKRKAAVRG